MSERTLIALLKVLSFPLHLLMRLIEEASGEGRWYGHQRRGMVTERPPLADAEYLRAQGASASDAPLCPAVRRSMSEACGLPSEAIRPQDRLADLWRMQWTGPDLLDLIFRLERSLGLKIPRAALEEEFRGGWPEEFGPFAAALVRVLRGLRRTHS
jgi:hypothetical protein